MEKPVTRGELFGEFLPALMAQLDKRFEQIDKRFEQQSAELKAFFTSELRRRVDTIEPRVTKLETAKRQRRR